MPLKKMRRRRFNAELSIPVTGFPLASVTATDWTDSVTGLPLASELLFITVR